VKLLPLLKKKKYWELYAKALYMRGWVYLDQWSFLGSEADLKEAQEDFGRAYKTVERLGISGPLKGAILAEWGSALASTASDREDRSKALAKIDQAGTIVSASGFKSDPRFEDVNTEWYLIDKAEAFVKVGWPNSAHEVLSEIKKDSSRKRRRYITMDIIEAEAYAARGKIDMAVAFAESALDTAQETQLVLTNRHIARIINLYEQLRQPGKYANSPDVARLGIELLKVRLPELF
jgi:tetratricopeptide (TPR) repeat protein